MTLVMRAGARAQTRRLARNGAPLKDRVLPAALERVRRELAGAARGNRQVVTS